MEELLKIKLMIDAKDERIKALQEALSLADKALKSEDKVIHIHNHYDQPCKKMHYPYYESPNVVWTGAKGMGPELCNPLK